MKKSVLFMVLVGATLSIFGYEREKVRRDICASFGTVILDGCKEVIEKAEKEFR